MANKIWLKSVDPSRQCCGCEGKTGPCSTCCSGVLVDYSRFFAGGDDSYAKNFEFKECVFLNCTSDVISYNSNGARIETSSGIFNFDENWHSISIPSGSILNISLSRSFNVENKPVSLFTTSNSLDWLYNGVREFASYGDILISLNELNGKTDWFEITASGGDGYKINKNSNQLSVTITGNVYKKNLASGHLGIINSYPFGSLPLPLDPYNIIGGLNFAGVLAGTLLPQISNYPIGPVIPCQLNRTSANISTSLQDAKYYYVDPLQHELNSVFEFGKFDANFGSQTIDLTWQTQPPFAAWKATDDSMINLLPEEESSVNSNSVSKLNDLPNYAKLIFGRAISVKPEVADGSFFGQTTQVNYTPSYELYYPTKWPTFNYTDLKECSLTIRVNKSVCIGLYAQAGDVDISTENGAVFASTGKAPNSVESQYLFTTTGTTSVIYDYNSNSSINYNKLYLYRNGNTSNRLSCVNGVVS